MDEALINAVAKAIEMEAMIDGGYYLEDYPKLENSRECAIAAIKAIQSYKYTKPENPCLLHGPIFMKSDCDVCRKAKDAINSLPEVK